jgi:uncharacterized protein
MTHLGAGLGDYRGPEEHYRHIMMEPRWIIDHLGMQPHPEGGYYVETFRDPGRDGARGAVSCIHYLLQAGENSAWHKVDAAEIWHFAAGDSLVLTLSTNGDDTTTHHLGPQLDVGQRPHVVVPAGCWQAAESLGRWTLVSCIVAPAFRFDGFELAPFDWHPASREKGTL